MEGRKIPGYNRYIMLPDGNVKNIATESMVKGDAHNYGRLRLVNDDGKRCWFDVKVEFPKIYPPEPQPVKEKKVRKVKPPKEKFVLPADKEAARKLHRAHKVSIAEVIEMRTLFAQGLFKPKDAPAKYGIAQQTAGKIIHGKIYANVALVPVPVEVK